MREKFIHEMILLLQSFEKVLKKIFFSKYISEEIKVKVLEYFGWATVCITTFENDPLEYDRKQLEENIFKIEECKIYLKKIADG